MVRDQRGYTLIEILAVLVIVLMLLGAVSTVMIFSQRLFISGSQQVNLHNDLRLASEKITRELRFAFFLEIIDESDWDVSTVDSAEYSYIYLDRETNTLIKLKDSKSNAISENVISDVFFVGNVSTLLFTLDGEGGGASYSLDSSVRLLNYRCNLFNNPGNPIALRYSLNPDIVIDP